MVAFIFGAGMVASAQISVSKLLKANPMVKDKKMLIIGFMRALLSIIIYSLFVRLDKNRNMDQLTVKAIGGSLSMGI